MPDRAQRRRLWFERSVLLAGLAAMIVAMIATRGALGLHGAALHVSIAFAAASVSWLAWVVTGPRGNSAALVVLTACTAASGSVLLLLYPSLAVYWFTFWACFSAGANFAVRVAAVITAGSAVILIAGYIDHRGAILAAFAAVAFVAYVFGRNRKKYTGLASEAMAAVDTRERAAARAERERIARDLHDVLGHSLTGVSMQIESAAAVLETSADTDRALSHLNLAGQLVRSGQQEAVATVHTLRQGEAAVGALVEELISAQQAAGARVRFTVTGTPRPLNADAALALYRVAQEALTNAAKYAPGQTVEAGLCYAADMVSICVLNDLSDGPCAGIGGGHGLPGMRERMTAVGGMLSAGRVAGRWRVEARVSA